jgi:hypothetical protein
MRIVLSFVGILVCAGTPLAAQAQAEVHARSQIDSVYAVRLLVEELSESIRAGKLAPRFASVPALQEAVTALTLARGSARPAPRRELGPLWDFRIEVVDVTHAAADRIVLRGRAMLDTDDGAERNTTFDLTFQKNDTGYWMLSDADGLLERLNTLRSRAGSRRGR